MRDSAGIQDAKKRLRNHLLTIDIDPKRPIAKGPHRPEVRRGSIGKPKSIDSSRGHRPQWVAQSSFSNQLRFSPHQYLGVPHVAAKNSICKG
jgi:hypothetical protein